MRADKGSGSAVSQSGTAPKNAASGSEPSGRCPFCGSGVVGTRCSNRLCEYEIPDAHSDAIARAKSAEAGLKEAERTIEGLARLGELVTAFVDPSGVLNVTGLKDAVVAAEARADAAYAALGAERAAVAEKARQWAAFYPEASDGRNTFVLFAEWVEARK